MDRSDDASSTPPVEASPSSAGVRFGRPWMWALALVAVLALPVGRLVMRAAQPAPLPVLWTLPAWRLTDQDGRAFGSTELRGKTYVANFIFTSCVASCPRLTRTMAQVQARLRPLADRVRLVSISVDPVTDTPARLREYGMRNGADFAMWSFVTGPEDVVLRAVEQGFRAGLQLPPRGPDGTFNPIELAHSNRFALVDAEGRLRGSYDVEDEAGVARLVADARALAGSE
jgi:protein SCO1/2